MFEVFRRHLPDHEATIQLARAFAEALKGGELLLLVGDLGAGKTTFTQGVGRGLGIPESVSITSPTYNILQSYTGRLTLHHLDLYRLSFEEELFELGFDELVGREAVVLAEWADRFESTMPQDALWIRIAHALGGGRDLVIETSSETVAESLRSWVGEMS